MFCPKCGNNIKDEEKVCSNCGETVDSNNNAAANKLNKFNTKSIISFVLSLAGLFLFRPFGIVGLILGIISKKEISKSEEAGKPFAIAGIVIGIVDIVIFLVLIVLFVASMLAYYFG